MNPNARARPAGDPLDLVETALDARGLRPHRMRRGIHEGLRAVCPSCGERNPTKLLVTRGSRVPLTIHCFAGCEWSRVLDALGLPWEIALIEEEQTVWRRWHARDTNALAHARRAVREAERWVAALERGAAEGPSPAGPLRLAGELVDLEAGRRGTRPRPRREAS